MLSMIANPITALPAGCPRSGLSRSDLVHSASEVPRTKKTVPTMLATDESSAEFAIQLRRHAVGGKEADASR
jgi:hypothetical protein